MYECLYVCLHIVVNVCLKGWGCARISVSPYVCVCLHMRVSSMSKHACTCLHRSVMRTGATHPSTVAFPASTSAAPHAAPSPRPDSRHASTSPCSPVRTVTFSSASSASKAVTSVMSGTSITLATSAASTTAIPHCMALTCSARALAKGISFLEAAGPCVPCLSSS